MSKIVKCYFDGACEPRNPSGAIGAGAFIEIDGVKAKEYSYFEPPKQTNTNNIAEYMAFEWVVDYLIENNLTNESIWIYGDSKLVVNQMNLEWGINNGAYVPYAERCRKKILQFENKPKISWIPREQNQIADDLSKGELIKNGITITERVKR